MYNARLDKFHRVPFSRRFLHLSLLGCIDDVLDVKGFDSHDRVTHIGQLEDRAV
jgi:hypothetical protein